MENKSVYSSTGLTFAIVFQNKFFLIPLCFQGALCQFIAHLYKCIPVTGDHSVPITQVHIIEDINQKLVDSIGNQQCQQVGMIKLHKSNNYVLKRHRSTVFSFSGGKP